MEHLETWICIGLIVVFAMVAALPWVLDCLKEVCEAMVRHGKYTADHEQRIQTLEMAIEEFEGR